MFPKKFVNLHGKYTIDTSRLVKAILGGIEFEKPASLKEDLTYSVNVKKNFLSWSIQDNYTLSEDFIKLNFLLLKKLKIISTKESN